MSRIIRSTQAQSDGAEQAVKIEIKDFFQPTTFQVDEDDKQQFNQESLLAERDQYLQQAEAKIAEERQRFEQYRNEQLHTIEQLKQVWQEEKLELEQQAHEDGFAAGYEEGIQRATEAMQGDLHIANETIKQAKQNAEKYIEDQESVILELALSCAERILDIALDKDEDLFVEVVKRGLKEAREMKEIKIYVAPTYYELITKNRDELAVMFPPDVPLLFFINEELEKHESYIETNHGRIVVSIDEQLNELRLKLNELLRHKDED